MQVIAFMSIVKVEKQTILSNIVRHKTNWLVNNANLLIGSMVVITITNRRLGLRGFTKRLQISVWIGFTSSAHSWQMNMI